MDDEKEAPTVQGRLKVLTTSLGEVPHIENPRYHYKAHYAKVIFNSTSRPRALFRVVKEISPDYREVEIELREDLPKDYSRWVLEFKPAESVSKNSQKAKLLIRLVNNLITEVTRLKRTGRE